LDAIGFPPVRVPRIGHGLCLSRAERQLVCVPNRGSWAGTTMAPEGEGHVTGQTCLGCNRNRVGKKRYYVPILVSSSGGKLYREKGVE
jgi:hypothetical protein